VSQLDTPVRGRVPLSSRKLRWLAVIAVATTATIYLVIAFSGIGKNLVYYWGPTQVRAAGAKAVHAAIRLGGMVAAGSIVRGHRPSELEFDVVDAGARIHVKSHGVPPQLFREGIGVVVEGTMTAQGYFAGDRLLVSHSNEYRAPSDLAHVDVERLMRSTSGLETDAAKDAP
jgi:cytochrome c-type biogenesis protein CcmE